MRLATGNNYHIHRPVFGSMTRSERFADPLTGDVHDYDQSTFLFRDPIGTFGLPQILKNCFKTGADIQV